MAIKLSTLLAHGTNLESDTAPKLGGNLDTNNFSIVNGANPVTISGNTYPDIVGIAGQTLTVDGAGNIVLVGFAQVVVVQKTPGPGEFASVAAAVASITDASSIKQYQVQVGPGTFIEPPITMKPYVTINGSGAEATVLESNNPNAHFITCSVGDGGSNFTLTGATGSGFALIYANIPTPTSVFFDNIKFGHADILALCEATTVGASTSIYIQNAIYGIPYQFNYGFLSRSVTGAQARMLVRNSTASSGTVAPYPVILTSASGPGSEIRILSTQLRGAPGGTSGIGIKVSDGGFARITSTLMRGFTTAIYSENVGIAPQIQVTAVAIDACTTDLNVAHPGTSGVFSGTSDQTKVIVDPGSPLVLSYTSSGTNPGMVIVGDLYLGRTSTTTTDVTDLIQQTPPMGMLLGGIVTTTINPLEINISAGYGYIRDMTTNLAKRAVWPMTTLTLLDATTYYITVDNTGTILASTSQLNLVETILLARIRTDEGIVEIIAGISQDANNEATYLDSFIREALGPVFVSGSITSADATPLHVDVSSGTYWYSTHRFTPLGGADISFDYYFHTAGAEDEVESHAFDNTQYDNGVNLVPVTAGYYTKHTLWVTSAVNGDIYYGVYAQSEHAALADAEASALPLQPNWFLDITVPIAAIITQQGNPNIVQIIDIRPRIGFTAGSTAAAANHGNLLGLLDDDHPQYLLVNGTRAMTGSLNMGSNTITSSGTINGITIQTHGARHGATAADPIPTAAPTGSLTPTSVNDIGIANTLSRSDHSHAMSGFQPLDTTLTSLAAYNTNGILTQTSADTFTGRTITAGSSKISISNGNGVSGNPAIDAVPNNIVNSITGPITTPSYIGFDTSLAKPTHAEGLLFYDNVEKTLAYYNELNGITLNIGQESWVRVMNITGSTITNGTIVYINGSSGTLPTIAPALANSESTSRVIGVLTNTVLNGNISYVTEFGLVHQLDTSAFTAGSILYLSDIIPGGFTTTSPSAPNFSIPVATVTVSNAITGAILIIPQTLKMGLGSSNQVLGVNGGATAPEYKTLTSGSGITVAHATNLVTFNLISGIVVPGTYKSVTVDTFGRVTAGTNPTTLAGYGITDAQPLDTTLTSLAAYNTNGILTQTSADTFTGRTITGTSARISITNGNGVSGNPAIDIDATYVGQTSITTLGTIGTGIWAGTTIAANHGGTGQATYTVGDILYADTTSTLAKLADVITGNALISGGTSTAPSWGKIGLTSHVSGILGTINGGTGLDSSAAANGSLLIGNSTGFTLSTLTATANQTTVSNAAGSITIGIASNPIIPGTTSIRIPAGTTAQRPGSPVAGQSRYNSTFNMMEYYNGTIWILQAGNVIQSTSGSIISSTGTPTITLGNTAPASTDGTQGWTQSFTPFVNTSKVQLDCSTIVDASNNGRAIVLALFRDTTCVYTTVVWIQTANTGTSVTFSFTDAPATTSAITYSLRYGGSSATTASFGTNNNGNTMGGTISGTFSIREKLG